MRLPPLSDEFPEIPVVPLIDVMFTLLTFFIVATLFIESNKAVNLTLPKSRTTVSVDSKKAEKVNISVDKDGNFFFDKVPMTRDQLLKQVAGVKDDTIIILSGDENTEYQDITRAMDVIREAGKYRVAMAAKQPPRSK